MTQNNTTTPVTLQDITIRTELRPGDLGHVMYRHGCLYANEYHFSLRFETYVGLGLYEFYNNYDPARDRVWIAEYRGITIGFLLLMHRENNAAQLRYFYIESPYRGIGLGKKMMELYMQFLRDCGYQSSYLWTTHELTEAAALYKRHGFRLTEEKASTAFGKPLTEQRYDLILQ
ncbi:MAG: GNAT family N-acetyltransferase [Bacteroidetes bacterium]|nr:GNAT family N-acetyltransferase [Bacteroidota bacterium]